MSSQNVIVFGPTGAVGSSVAITAQKHGAKVYLAMRDTTKTIPNLPPTLEKAGNFQRIKADLTDPSSIIAAVKESKAITAFVYRIPTPRMAPTFQALKDAGIKFVVFLSSNWVQNAKESYTNPAEYIAWTHAQAECELEGVFGKGGYVAVRPAWFGSNVGQWTRMVRENGEIPIISSKMLVDPIAPSDIGKVCGALVAGGPEKAGGKDFIRICGPELLTVTDIVGVISKVVGKEIKVTEVDEEKFTDEYLKYAGIPEPFAKVLAASYRRRSSEVDPDEMYRDQYEESASSILKYGGVSLLNLRAGLRVIRRSLFEEGCLSQRV